MPVRIPEFQSWTPQVVRGLLTSENDETVNLNALFMSGDHWMDALGWIGPRIDGDTQSDELIKKGFTSRNVIREIARRHAEGVMGNEPDWGLQPLRRMAERDKPTDAEQRLIDEAEGVLTDWWDERGVLEEFADAVEQSTWARRGTLRLFVPSGLLGEPVEGLVPLPEVATLQEALRYIYIESVPYNQGLLYTDWRTRAQAGAVVYLDDEGKSVMEWNWLRDPRDPLSPTFLNSMVEGQKPTDRTPFEWQMGGRLMTHEIRQRRLLISEQLQQIQRALNLTLSVLPRNMVSAGFLERIFLGAQMPGKWDLDSQGRRVKFTPDKYVTGPNTTSFVSGQEGETDPLTGKTPLTTPDVRFREPVPPTGTVEAKHSQYEDALEEAEQVHVLIEGAATPSGVSRQEARAGYGRSLRRTQRPSQRAGRWILEAALAMGEVLMNQPGKYTKKLRATFDCRLDLGPISPDDQRVAMELGDGGVLSDPTVLVRVGVQDPDAEIARRNGTPAGQLALKTKQLEALDAGTKIPGATLEGVAEFIGVKDTDVEMLTKGAPDAKKDPEGNPVMPPDPPAIPGVPRGPVQQ